MINFVQDVQITFSTMDPHWSEKTATSKSYLAIAADLNEEISNDGNVGVYPKFYFIFGTVGALGTLAITMWGYTITITQTIATWWILIIDWENKEVTYNATAIDYTGTFPLLEVWANPITFDFGAGSYVCDIAVIYYEKFR